MPRWKLTEQIVDFKKDGEVFNEDWMNYDKVFQYMPDPTPWSEDRPPRIEEIDIWEVISEITGPIGVYAAWQPYAELYIVTSGWSIVAEFSGWNANKRLENYLIENKIPYQKGPDINIPEYENKIIIVK